MRIGFHMKFTVVGHTTVDLIYVAKHPTRPTPGGPSVYASMTALRLGCESMPVSKVGYDFPEEFMVWLSKSQLNTNFYVRDLNSKTTRFKLVYGNSGRTLKLLSLCSPIAPNELVNLPKVELAHVGSVAGEVGLDTLKALRIKAQMLSIDVQGFIRKFKVDGEVYEEGPLNPEILSNADIVKFSMKEAEALTGASDPMEAVKKLGKMHRGVVLLTLGELGSLCTTACRILRSPPYKPPKFVDPTGAGDSFTAGFTVEFFRSGDLDWSLAVASAASSFVTEGYGPSRFGLKNEVYERAETLIDKIKKLSF
ncbi:MAG: PfkB family carbohydrate kinase [Candidatus Bathyarchaeia archaeon]